MKIFEAGKIGSIETRNRMVRSATWEGMATDKAEVTGKLVDCISKLADGGVGLIISSHCHIERGGQASPFQVGIFDDSFVPGLAKIVEAAHRGGAKILAQLNHAGCHALPELTGMMSFGVSAMTSSRGGMALAMSSTAIKHKIVAFAAAARRAKEAGFDGIQVHGAHGYLISQFLSPFYNKRTDEWGGSIQNRLRFISDTITAIKLQVGEMPLTVKLNATDCIKGGMTTDDFIDVVKYLEQAGVHAVEMSGGLTHPDADFSSSRPIDPKTPSDEGYYISEAKIYKATTKMPLILVGGLRSLEASERILEDNIADFISFCRPLIREPNLPDRWRSGKTDRAACISCNACRAPAVAGEGLKCVL